MLPIIKTALIKVYNPILQKKENKLKNICLSMNNREVVYNGDGYYYLNKNNTISDRLCKAV
jgi:hypothetical protein